jgi:CubicO group peptidase (beta-lactamase class C family)
MRCKIGSLILLTVLSCIVFGCARTDGDTERTDGSPLNDKEVFNPVRRHIEKLVADGEIPSMAVAVARYGRIFWEEGFGYADREGNVRATEDTRYPLASISKPFTATALMVLVERGLIRLDDPIDHYLGEVKLTARVGNAQDATVRRAASNTAGLPLHSHHFYDNEPDRPPSFDETLLRYGNIVTEPGVRFQYSNLGYGLLGYIISRVSGIQYAEVMREEVFVPLGLYNTSVGMESHGKADYAVKYAQNGSVVPPSVSDSPGAGMVFSSVHDLIRFAMFHLNGGLPGQEAIISSAAIEEMQHPVPGTRPTRPWEGEGSGYGIGWNIGVTAGGLLVVQHPGGIQGVTTVVALIPKKDIAIAVLTNTDCSWPDVILIEILSILLPEEVKGFAAQSESPVAEPSFSPDKELIGSWCGVVHTYLEPIPIVVEIKESAEVLLKLDGQGSIPLQQVSYQSNFPLFNNAGDGPFLRGRFSGSLCSDDVIRGNPGMLWLELKLRAGVLSGSLIAFSQRENPIGPLTHWVETLRSE